MIDAGIFGEDDRLELLEGLILPMSPQSPEHADVIQRLTNRLARMLGPAYEVRPQLPLAAGSASEPEPDLAVVPAGRTHREHPGSAPLVIEVARDSIRKDRLLKAGIYARAAVSEYWIVNIADGCVEVHRDPDAGQYRSARVFRPGEELASSAVPQIVLAVSEVLGI